MIFDPERILTDTGACRFYAWKETAREQGIVYDEELDAQTQGMDAASRLDTVLTRAHRIYSPAERLVLMTRQSDLYDEALAREGEGILLPGAKALLQSLHGYGFMLGAVMTDGMAGQIFYRLPAGRFLQVYAREGKIAEQLADVQKRLHAQADQCLLVTSFPDSARAAQRLGMGALLLPEREDQASILQQILSAAEYRE